MRYKNATDVEYKLNLKLEIMVEGRKNILARARKQGSPSLSRADGRGKTPVVPLKHKQDTIGTLYGDGSKDSYGMESFREALVVKDLNSHVHDTIGELKKIVERVICFSQEDQPVKKWLELGVWLVDRDMHDIDPTWVQEDAKVGLDIKAARVGESYILLNIF